MNTSRYIRSVLAVLSIISMSSCIAVKPREEAPSLHKRKVTILPVLAARHDNGVYSIRLKYLETNCQHTARILAEYTEGITGRSLSRLLVARDGGELETITGDRLSDVCGLLNAVVECESLDDYVAVLEWCVDEMTRLARARSDSRLRDLERVTGTTTNELAQRDAAGTDYAETRFVAGFVGHLRLEVLETTPEDVKNTARAILLLLNCDRPKVSVRTP